MNCAQPLLETKIGPSSAPGKKFSEEYGDNEYGQE